MIKLLTYIKACVDAEVERNQGRASRRTDASQCYRSLALYLRSNPDAELLRVIDPEFVLGYGRYLLSGQYAKDYLGDDSSRDLFTTGTLLKHLSSLRARARKAMQAGLLPSVDVFPSVIDTLSAEFDLPVDDDGRRKRFVAVEAPRHDFAHEYQRLLQALLPDLANKHRAQAAMPVLLYLAGVYTYGMEMDELLELRLPDDATLADVTMRNRHLGIDMPLPGYAISLIELLNRNKPKDGYVIRRHAGWRGLEPDELAQYLSAQVSKYMEAYRLALFSNQSATADWLAFAKNRGVDDATIIALGRAKATGCEPEGTDIDQVLSCLPNDHGLLYKRWYVLRSYSPGLPGAEMKAQLARYLDDIGQTINPRQDLYDPQDVKKKNIRGRMVKRNNPAINCFLFVRCRLELAKRIDRFHPQASFLRQNGDSNTFATVSHDAVLQLARFLRDFRDEVEIIGLEHSGSSNEFAEGVRVRILSGPMMGFEGTISQVLKHKDSLEVAAGPYTNPEDKTTYVVDVDGFAFAAKANVTLEGINIEPIK